MIIVADDCDGYENCHFCPRIRMCISTTTILFAVYRLFFSSKLHRVMMAELY